MHRPQRGSLLVPLLPAPEAEAETEGQSCEGPHLRSLRPNPHFTSEEPEEGPVKGRDSPKVTQPGRPRSQVSCRLVWMLMKTEREQRNLENTPGFKKEF